MVERGWPGPPPPSLSAQLKEPARRQGGDPDHVGIPGGEEPKPSHCTSADGQQGGRGRGTAGVVDPARRRDISLGRRRTGEITIGTQSPPALRSTAQGGFDGRGGCDRPRCPARSYGKPLGSRGRPPQESSTSWSSGKGRGETGRSPGLGGRSSKTVGHPDRVEDRPPVRGPFLHTLRAQVGLVFVGKCSGPNLSSQRAFFRMAGEHKKPVPAPAGVAPQSHVA